MSGALVYIALKNYINRKAEETTIEEWIEFPALEAMLAKVDKEDKETNIQVSFVKFRSFDAYLSNDCRRLELTLHFNDMMPIETTILFVIHAIFVSMDIVSSFNWPVNFGVKRKGQKKK